MPITVKYTAAGRQPVQRNVASLVGGFVIAFGCFVLFLLVAGEILQAPLTLPIIVFGAVLATGIGVWIRLADL